MSIADFAERIGVSEKTVRRLEGGDDGVGLGVLAGALQALSEVDRLETLLNPENDSVGAYLNDEALPKRIRTRIRTAKKGPAATAGPRRDAVRARPSPGEGPKASEIDPEGMGF